MSNDEFFDDMNDDLPDDEEGGLLDDPSSNEERDGVLDNRILMDVNACQERDEICYIRFDSEAQMIYPRDPEDYIVDVLVDMKEKDYAEYKDANVTVIFPDEYTVKRGDNEIHSKPSDIAWFIQSHRIMTMKSLQDILDLQGEIPYFQNLELVMASSVLAEYEDAPKETWKIRQLVLDLLRSSHYDIADQFIYKGYKRHNETFSGMFKHELITKARAHGKREEASKKFTEKTRMLPQEIHSYQSLEEAIGKHTDRIEIFTFYLASLPADLHPTVVQNILIPLCENVPDIKISLAARRALTSQGYRFEKRTNAWIHQSAAVTP